MKRLFENQCEHNMYLGSDVKADYYLYNGDDYFHSKDSVSICKRTGIDGEYQSIVHRYNPKTFIKTLNHIVSINKGEGDDN
tara:strand:+ start:309 stop:551 length:243 start_codon:yes stop_codon:yes gene_type:complete